MTLFTTVDPRPIHFMGIAGAGMSGLALLAKEQSVAITGGDSGPTGAADLAAIGVEIWRGHDPGHVAGSRALVVTAAVPGEHPELKRARALGVPVVRRADALSQAVAGGTVVAVSGTHGKTTTTVMVTEALAAAGRDPTGLAGGRVARWGGNARVGGRELYVVEADEYDRAFLSLRPTVAVVNNVEADHLECYDGSVAVLEQAFVQFAGGARRVIVGGGDAGAQRVMAAVRAPVWRVGVGADADVRITELALDEHGSTARIELPGGEIRPLTLRVPGLHNVRNAAAALAVAHELGADLERALAALAEFTGVGRRFERVGEACGVTVVDDYAHHPTEVQATLAAARQAFPRRRVVAVFQPHLFSRTLLHGDALGRALAAADVVVVAPIYGAREQPLPGVSAALGLGAARAAAASDVSRAPDRARWCAQPGAGCRDCGAASRTSGERVRRHAVARRSRAGIGGRGRGAGGAAAARRALGGATGSGAGGARGRAARIGARPRGSRRRGSPGAGRPGALGPRPAHRGERRFGSGGGAGADPVRGSGAVSDHHRRAGIRARWRAPGSRASSRAGGAGCGPGGHTVRGARGAGSRREGACLPGAGRPLRRPR